MADLVQASIEFTLEALVEAMFAYPTREATPWALLLQFALLHAMTQVAPCTPWPDLATALTRWREEILAVMRTNLHTEMQTIDHQLRDLETLQARRAMLCQQLGLLNASPSEVAHG